jgi:hypothetical protein
MIYLIESGDYYKIGKSKNVEERLKSYRLHNPNIKLIDTADVNDNLEKVAHDILIDLKYDSEWFSKDQRVVDVFNHIKNGDYENINKLLRYKENESIISNLKFELKSKNEKLEELSEEINDLKIKVLKCEKKTLKLIGGIVNSHEISNTNYKLAQEYLEDLENDYNQQYEQ